MQRLPVFSDCGPRSHPKRKMPIDAAQGSVTSTDAIWSVVVYFPKTTEFVFVHLQKSSLGLFFDVRVSGERTRPWPAVCHTEPKYRAIFATTVCLADVATGADASGASTMATANPHLLDCLGALPRIDHSTPSTRGGWPADARRIRNDCFVAQLPRIRPIRETREMRPCRIRSLSIRLEYQDACVKHHATCNPGRASHDGTRGAFRTHSAGASTCRARTTKPYHGSPSSSAC